MSSVAGRQVIPGVLVRSGGTSFEWSLEDISEGFYREHVFFYFICFGTGQGSCRIDKLSWMVVHHRNYTHKLPPFNPGFVQDNDKFSRVQVACKDSVLPFFHTNSMPGLQRVRSVPESYMTPAPAARSSKHSYHGEAVANPALAEPGTIAGLFSRCVWPTELPVDAVITLVFSVHAEKVS